MLKMYAKLQLKVVERGHGEFEVWAGGRFVRDGVAVNCMTTEELAEALGPEVGKGFANAVHAVNFCLVDLLGGYETFDWSI
jgi:hypothetical protein